MRESEYGWLTVPFGSDPPGSRFAVGDVVVSGCYLERGTVVNVGTATLAIQWSDGNGGQIVYPIDAPYLRKLEFWEL